MNCFMCKDTGIIADSFAGNRSCTHCKVSTQRASLENARTDLIESLQAEIKSIKESINTTQIDDFWAAVRNEAAFQVKKWGDVFDKEKPELDWLWLIGYLATKATQAKRYDDPDKYKHHIITTAAACFNWHTAAMKD